MEFLPNTFSGLPQPLTSGWQLGLIYTAASGVPITPFFGSTDISGTGELNDRPNVIADPNTGPQTATAWFNKAAFVAPALGTFGNARRNSVIGPGTNILDFSLDKMTKVSERLSVQFRSEFFNILNHPNFSLPNVQFDSAAFGTLNQTPDVAAGNPRLGDGGPRVIQFGLKLVF